MKTCESLWEFAHQRPGFDPHNYDSYRSYKNEMNEVVKDLSDFRTLYAIAARRLGEAFETRLHTYLKNTSGRLKLNERDELEYCTGQYFPTEFRPAACSVLASLLWADYRDEKDSEGNEIYKDGNDLRKAIRRNFNSRRISKHYFN